MNKTILILLCLLLGVSPNMAQQRKMADVQHIADSVLNRPTRFGKKAKKVKTDRVIATSELQSSKQDAFYICTAGEDGYAIISADERMTPVLGFSQNRGFDPTNIPAGLQDLLDGYTREYEALANGKPMRKATHIIEGIQEQVGPLLITQWGQNAPFNNRCPEVDGERCITGCVAISTSQTLYYYQYPDSAVGTVEYISKTNNIPIQEDLSSFKFNWPFIKGSYKYGAMEKECDAVADLVYCCAAAVQMDFGIKESGANSTNQVKALVENFGYDPDIACIRKDYMNTNEWQTLMLNELNNKRPIIYAAASPQVGGHSFIIDGYKGDENGYPFYHVNWGWEGNFDDYYKLSAMEADGDEYSQRHEAIIYIQPDNKVRDSESFWQVENVIPTPAIISPEKDKFTVTLTNLYNHSYKTFYGKIEFYLQNANNQELLLGEIALNNVPFNYGSSSFTKELPLPKNIEEGEYNIIIRSKASNSDKYETVTCTSPIKLIVSSITEHHTPQMMVYDLINAGEGRDGLSMAVRVRYPCNRDPMPFTGWLQMAVADDDGNILLHFGSVHSINDMKQGSVEPNTILFEGQLPDYLDDGKYRLCLAANQNGYLEWGFVTGFSGEDLSFPFWLEDGKILYHKGSEEDLPEFYADIQVTDMQVTGIDPATKRIDMQMQDVINMGSEPFIGQFSMVVYDDTDKLMTEFGNTQRVSSVLNHYTMISNKTYEFSGNLPDKLTDGNYTIKIAAKQDGCRGWSPIRGWKIINGAIGGKDNELGFDFHIINNIMYDTDGYTSIENERVKSEKTTEDIYDLSGRKVNSQPSTLNSQLKKGLYIVGNKKMVK